MMLSTILAAILIVFIVVVGILTWKNNRVISADLNDLEYSVNAFVVTVIEQQVTLNELVESTTTQVQDVHKALSEVSFDILESMPQTREASQKMRGAHDLAADNIYTTIRTVNKGFRLLKTEFNAQVKKRSQSKKQISSDIESDREE